MEEIYKEDKYYKREYSYYRNNTVKSMVETGDSNISINYQYDEAGNISEKVEIKDGVEERYTYEYNEANRMVTEMDVNGVRRSYRYDLNGNRTQRVISNEEEAETEEKEVIDFFYYNYEDQLEEIVLHNGKVFTYGYDGEGNRLWRTHAQYPLVKPPVEEDERLEDPAAFPGYNKDKSNNGNGNSNGKNADGETQTSLILSSGGEYASTMMIAKVDNSSKGNSGKTNPSKEDSTTKDNPSKENQGNGKDNQGNQGNDKENEGKNNDNNGHDKNDNEEGKGWAIGKDKDKGNKGKRLGWYKNGKVDSNNPDLDLTNPEIFEVTNFINDINLEHTEVLMTSDVEGNYRGVYTYGADTERISVEDLGEIEGQPNNPLYYLHDALGTTSAITNMNAEVIDSNRFGPYGEPLDPVAKNARLTNSPFGYTGEAHDIEARLVYLRARYYEPGTMQFLQQDTVLGNIHDPLSRNLYAYGQGNPVMYVDPSGHMVEQFLSVESKPTKNVTDNPTKSTGTEPRIAVEESNGKEVFKDIDMGEIETEMTNQLDYGFGKVIIMGKEYPIYVPEFINGSNTLLNDEGWITLEGEGFREKYTDINWGFVIGGFGAEYSESNPKVTIPLNDIVYLNGSKSGRISNLGTTHTGVAGTLLICAGEIAASIQKNTTIYYISITIQQKGNNYRAIVELESNKNPLTSAAGKSGYYISETQIYEPNRVWEQHFLNKRLIDMGYGEYVQGNRYMNIYATVDARHADDYSVGYLSLESSGSLLLTPKLYPNTNLQLVQNNISWGFVNGHDVKLNLRHTLEQPIKLSDFGIEIIKNALNGKVVFEH